MNITRFFFHAPEMYFLLKMFLLHTASREHSDNQPFFGSQPLPREWPTSTGNFWTQRALRWMSRFFLGGLKESINSRGFEMKVRLLSNFSRRIVMLPRRTFAPANPLKWGRCLIWGLFNFRWVGVQHPPTTQFLHPNTKGWTILWKKQSWKVEEKNSIFPWHSSGKWTIWRSCS